MRVVVADLSLGLLEPHYFSGHGTKPDRFGKVEGYRCCPPGKGMNKSAAGIFYRSIDDLADHLKANPEWGVRVSKPSAPPSLRYDNILVDGVSR